MMNVRQFYQHALAERGYTADPAQELAVDRLQQLFDEWVDYEDQRSSTIKRLLNRPTVPRGLYLWGGVGRGKSFLMDGFYSVVPVSAKTRVHFHEFMRGIHRQLDELRGMEDPLDAVALRIAEQYRLICFDEFHVSDVADAMILYNLLNGLFDQGVSFVMTSNYTPQTLYPDGLHRDRIMPAIQLLENRMDVVNVDAGVDYRHRALEQVDAYHMPSGPAADAALAQAFDKIAETADEDPTIHIESRDIVCRRRAGGVLWCNFSMLCGGPRSQYDYLEIATRFHTVIVSDVPQMSAAMAAEARRFVWLVDVLYDRRVSLLISADAAPDALYTEGALVQEFARTASRIREMQSRHYAEGGRQNSGSA